MVLGAETFLGEDLIPLLLLALGGAMAVGNILAIVRPPQEPRPDKDLAQAPLIRSLGFALLGAIAAIWALASLVRG